ncbi:MAG: hypothetical protein ABJA83_15945 [Burkholderiaceae bacterium]
MLRLIFAVCLAAAPLVAGSQSMIYKIQMPDGSVMFSDTVPSGGKVLEEREAKSTPRVTTLPSQPGKAGASSPGIVRPGAIPGATTRPANPNATPGDAVVSVSAAERDLALARRKLEVGREPLPGERRGLAGGGSRLTPEYEARVAGMERDVATAEARLKRAYEAR